MKERISIAAVGDIFLGRRVEDIATKKGKGYIFDLVKPFLRGNDVVFGNLESPVSNMKPADGIKGLIAKPASLDELKEAGFNAVSVANNHIMDFGLQALGDTIAELDKRGIGYAGAGLSPLDAQRPLRKVGGKNVTLLAYYGMGGGIIRKSGGFINRGDGPMVWQDIRNARDEADVVLVSIHWGRGTSSPMRHQVEFAHRLIDHGAKVVLGSGPHVLQPVEQYNGGLIAYSLGDFVFDHRDWQKSMVLHVSFADGSIESASITPACIGSEHRPEPITADADPALCETIQALLVQQLDGFESDASIVPRLHGKNVTLVKVLRKIVLKDHRAYPLSLYLGGLRELIKERWFSKS